MKLTYETANSRLETSTCTRMQFMGQRCEGAVMAALLKAGKRVLFPYTDARYDLVVEQDGQYVRIQCKAGRLAKNHRAIEFSTCSVNTVHGKHVQQSYHNQAELFGVYCGELDKVYLVPVEDVGLYHATLHLRKPRNNGRAKGGIRMAAEYEFSPPNVKFELDVYEYPVVRDPATSYSLKDARGKWFLRWRERAPDGAVIRRSKDVGLVSSYPTRAEILAAMGWNPDERLRAQIPNKKRTQEPPIFDLLTEQKIMRKRSKEQAVKPKNSLAYPKDWNVLSLAQRQAFLRTRWSQPEVVQ